MGRDITVTTCPGCGEKNCGIIWFARKKREDPCTGETCCGLAEVWHDWEYTTEDDGSVKHGLDYFFKKKEQLTLLNFGVTA